MTTAAPRWVMLRPGTRAYVLIAKAACVVGDVTVAVRLDLVAPRTGSTLELHIPREPVFAYRKGGAGDPSNTVAVTPVEPSARALFTR